MLARVQQTDMHECRHCFHMPGLHTLQRSAASHDDTEIGMGLERRHAMCGVQRDDGGSFDYAAFDGTSGRGPLGQQLHRLWSTACEYMHALHHGILSPPVQAFTPALTLLLCCLAGLERPTPALAASVLLIAAGTGGAVLLESGTPAFSFIGGCDVSIGSCLRWKRQLFGAGRGTQICLERGIGQWLLGMPAQCRDARCLRAPLSVSVFLLRLTPCVHPHMHACTWFVALPNISCRLACLLISVLA